MCTSVCVCDTLCEEEKTRSQYHLEQWVKEIEAVGEKMIEARCSQIKYWTLSGRMFSVCLRCFCSTRTDLVPLCLSLERFTLAALLCRAKMA